MAKYNWCLGIVLNGNLCEQTCRKRDNCVYYIEDLFSRFKIDQLEEDFLLNEPGRECRYFVARNNDSENVE